MAIGKLLSPHCSAVTRPMAYRLDRTFPCQKTWPSRRPGALAGPPSTCGLVTPPPPFAKAERKASPNTREHNTVPGNLPTVQMPLFAASEGRSGGQLRIGTSGQDHDAIAS